jgi:hypothetical protein
LDERDFVEVEALPRQDLPNLLARILIKTPSLVNQSARNQACRSSADDQDLAPRHIFPRYR